MDQSVEALHWVVISGTWRDPPPEALRDVRERVRGLLLNGLGVRTGGALGVDLAALETCLALDLEGRLTEVVIPTTLDRYLNHYRARLSEGVISRPQFDSLAEALSKVSARRPGSLRELPFETVDRLSYFARNSALLEGASALVAFQVDESAGTQDTIEKAFRLGLHVEVFPYSTAKQG